MKKLLVLSVLLGLLVLPVFAEHVSIDMGGDLTFGTAGDFDAVQADKIDFTWDVIVGIDDYNSFTWSLGDVGFGEVLDKALVTTDVGMWAGLPVGFKVMWGYDDPDANEFGDVTGYGNQAYDLSPTAYWGLGFLVSYNIIEVEVAFNPGVGATDEGDLLAGLALKEPIPGLNAEVYWFQGGPGVLAEDFDMGCLAVGAAYATEVAGASLEAGISFDYDMDDAALIAWDYGFGLAVGYSMFDVTMGLMGMEDDALATLDFTVDIAPIDMVSVYGGAVMSFVDATDTFQGADIGVNAHVGLVEVYLGYLITENGAGEYNADFGDVWSLDGGMYFKGDVNY